jgi:hypothetical protein
MSRGRFGFQENLIVLIAVGVLLVAAVFWADKPPTMEKTDFSVTYIGGRMVHSGMGAKLYDLEEQQKVKAQLLKNAEPLVYEHPPFEALLLSPLGGLPYRYAYLIWGLLNVAIWLLMPGLFRPYARSPEDGLAYVVLWLLFAPLGITLFQGQSSLFLLLIYIATYIHAKRDEEWKAGIFLGLGLFKFQLVIPLVLIFLLRRKWKFICGFTLSAAVLGLLSLVAVGWSGILSYVKLLTAVGSHPKNISYGAATDMATLQGFIHAVAGSAGKGWFLGAAVALISLSLIAFTAWYWNRVESDPFGFDRMFAVAIVVSLATSFHMFAHDMSPLLLSMFLVMPYITEQNSWYLRAALRFTLIAFWTPPIFFILIGRHATYLLFPVLALFGILIMLVKTKDQATWLARSVAREEG